MYQGFLTATKPKPEPEPNVELESHSEPQSTKNGILKGEFKPRSTKFEIIIIIFETVLGYKAIYNSYEAKVEAVTGA